MNDTTEAIVERCRKEGRLAYREGKRTRACTYPDNSLEQYSWRAGFGQDIRNAAQIITDWKRVNRVNQH